MLVQDTSIDRSVMTLAMQHSSSFGDVHALIGHKACLHAGYVVLRALSSSVTSDEVSVDRRVDPRIRGPAGTSEGTPVIQTHP
jgi:hypothetical protein